VRAVGDNGHGGILIAGRSGPDASRGCACCLARSDCALMGIVSLGGKFTLDGLDRPGSRRVGVLIGLLARKEPLQPANQAQAGPQPVRSVAKCYPVCFFDS